MTGKEEIGEPSGPSTPHKSPEIEPAAHEFDPKKAYQIAPDGDIILYTPGKSPSPFGPPEPVQSVSFLVSSAHLKLSSKYFNTLLSDRWSGARDPTAGGLIAIEVNDCKSHILHMILDIIHGHTRKVPRQITLDRLAEFTVAIDFFQCVEVVELVAQMWIETLRPQVPSRWSAMIPTWIMISSVFNNAEILSQVSKIAAEEGTGPLQTNGLPIPGFVKRMST
ncbi:hypothetical protein N7452_009312 [Penicillium brevicompactum]|uniref:BTB domain-containing protein n=1 Tax=Penicillium brevicompactum TaxID=5074 RepID=A0A9W9U9Z2_PENBR|nr:hypothetical protein N7452_009312 [Penicillium brevicompactum]